MGTRVVVDPDVLDGDWPGVDIILPSMPTEVPWQSMSSQTLHALERAGRALGRMEGAVRSGGPSIAGCYISRSSEGYASAALALAVDDIHWMSVIREFGDETLDFDHTNAAGLAASVIRQSSGLGRWDGSEDTIDLDRWFDTAIKVWPGGALGETARVPERWKRALGHDVGRWITDLTVPRLVRAAVVMLVAAATDPEDGATGVAARAMFTRVLEITGGIDAWRTPPISMGFIPHPEHWRQVAHALATEGDPDPDVIDDALRLVFDAVARGAGPGGPLMEWAGRIASEAAKSVPRARRSWRLQNLIDGLVGLPALSVDDAARLSNYSPRGVRRVLKELVDRDLVRERRTRNGDAYFTWKGAPRPWLDMVTRYPMPGEPWPDYVRDESPST
ncbi:hypothetical protein [Demequina sp. NBRC 110051]|uniref:hypothetical protein n=1 Tax=Demequina sp. NBRC 110051 TaxID=1570340 RepID=UPI0009FFEEC1|nr:hypothetical protein [Demequina sp. NBRC 110051]